MNIFIGILLIFALLGLFDKLFGGKLGLAAEFDSGLESMASLALSIVGVYCIRGHRGQKQPGGHRRLCRPPAL